MFVCVCVSMCVHIHVHTEHPSLVFACVFKHASVFKCVNLFAQHKQQEPEYIPASGIESTRMKSLAEGLVWIGD